MPTKKKTNPQRPKGHKDNCGCFVCARIRKPSPKTALIMPHMANRSLGAKGRQVRLHEAQDGCGCVACTRTRGGYRIVRGIHCPPFDYVPEDQRDHAFYQVRDKGQHADTLFPVMKESKCKVDGQHDDHGHGGEDHGHSHSHGHSHTHSHDHGHHHHDEPETVTVRVNEVTTATATLHEQQGTCMCTACAWALAGHKVIRTLDFMDGFLIHAADEGKKYYYYRVKDDGTLIPVTRNPHCCKIDKPADPEPDKGPLYEAMDDMDNAGGRQVKLASGHTVKLHEKQDGCTCRACHFSNSHRVVHNSDVPSGVNPIPDRPWYQISHGRLISFVQQGSCRRFEKPQPYRDHHYEAQADLNGEAEGPTPEDRIADLEAQVKILSQRVEDLENAKRPKAPLPGLESKRELRYQEFLRLQATVHDAMMRLGKLVKGE